MSRILIVGGDTVALSDFTKSLMQKNGNRVSWTHSGRDALSLIIREKIDTVVVDEKLPHDDSFNLVAQLLNINPMVNCALVSSLPMAEFHEATEGLGVFMQLPPQPGRQHAEKMLQLLEAIDVLMNF